MAKDADSAGTDLGRRIAEQRGRAGLTVAETAERAGMSPTYVAYLESSTSPNPTQGALSRLASVFRVPPGALSGAGLNLPPGQRDAAHHPVLETLTAAECMAHIAAGGIGRLLFVEPDRGPVAFPVNYRVDRNDVVFRTGSHARITDAVQQQQVSFDVDHFDDTLAEGWSVLLTGSARFVTDPEELERVGGLGIQPWAPGSKEVYVRLSASKITGRRIRVTD